MYARQFKVFRDATHVEAVTPLVSHEETPVDEGTPSIREKSRHRSVIEIIIGITRRSDSLETC